MRSHSAKQMSTKHPSADVVAITCPTCLVCNSLCYPSWLLLSVELPEIRSVADVVAGTSLVCLVGST